MLRGEADIAIATEAIAEYPELRVAALLPVEPLRGGARRATRSPGVKPLTLEALAQYPIVTYDFAFAGRSLVEKAFEQRGLKPNVVLTAIDADVIKTYVELGLGVGIMATMAFDAKRDRGPARDRCRAPVRVEHHARGHQARRLPARLRLRFHRDCSPRTAASIVERAARRRKLRSTVKKPEFPGL